MKERLNRYKSLYPSDLSKQAQEQLQREYPPFIDLVGQSVFGFIPAYDFLTDFLFVYMLYYTFTGFRERTECKLMGGTY